ncbi:glycosyltransferase [Kineosporia sp. R_H_3]|uniref:glycosyltransferase n=1 Tax=Kineosporia sp. R_H_3 TaxID=1961848 RepID=UPI000B4AF5E6|nr:glycosyltransferase [Kineosporia sp. R_H_3]
MRLLVVAEDAPDRSATTGNGSTMITAHLVPLLAKDAEVDLAYFDDGRRVVPDDVRGACRRVVALPVRPSRQALVATPFTRLPRATWRRASGAAVAAVAGLAAEADAVWVHGLHAFAATCAAVEPLATPPAVLAHEVDPWADHWRQRASGRTGAARRYDLLQAARAQALEERTSRLARAYAVVAPADAERLGARLGRPVLALPNGVGDRDPAAEASAAAAGERLAPGPTVGFLGSLDYPPNVDAVQRLVGTVLPRVASRVPDVGLHVAGRRAGAEVTALAGGAVTLHGTVAAPAAFYSAVDVMAFPGDLGTGTKNTVNEALLAGAAVVASRHAARGLADEGQLVLAGSDDEVADEVAALLLDPVRREELRARARAWSAARLPSWDDAAAALLAALV